MPPALPRPVTPRALQRRPVLALLAAAALSGCSALGSLQTAATPLDTYELRPLPAAAGRAGRARLEVATPTATEALAGDRIVVKPTPLEIASLPGARWVDPATEHVQLLLVRSLANTGRFALVTGSGAGPAADMVLLTDLAAFQVEMAEGRDTVRISMAMTLLNDAEDRVIASRVFTSTAPVADMAPAAVTAAFDAAMTHELGEITAWVLRHAGG